MKKASLKRNGYDNIPVECCGCCLSLDNPEVQEIDGVTVKVCWHCGSTATKRIGIEEWEERFCRKYSLGRYIDLPGRMTWEEIMQHENRETFEDVAIRREAAANEEKIIYIIN